MPLKRLFASGSVLPHDMTRFQTCHGITAPEDWSLEAIEAFAPALLGRVPKRRKVAEENTLPSWMWKYQASGKETQAETHVMAVFNRIAGAAAYKGWKNGLWESEVEASTFFDEVRALLLTRRLLIPPSDMARMGQNWAYGISTLQPDKSTALSQDEAETLILENETVDTILGNGSLRTRNKWLHFLEKTQQREDSCVSFADTQAEWHITPATTPCPRAMFNLMAFRHIDGSFDVAGLCQAVRVTTFLLDLHYEAVGAAGSKDRSLALSFGNLASLLMSLGIPFDSDKARNTAAAIAGLITATSCEASASLAARLGPCETYLSHHENVLRNLENQIRAAFGEKTDYDHLSVLPQTMDVASGIDLVLLSSARRAYETSLEAVRTHGLRHIQLTSLFYDQDIQRLGNLFSQGVDAESALTCSYLQESDVFDRYVNPALPMGLAHLEYDYADTQAICDHVVGYKTLVAAPGINHSDLREKGFDDEALASIERQLPHTEKLELAITPWNIGLVYCSRKFDLSDEDLSNPSFNLMRHVGFSQKDIDLAQAFCCGHRRVQGVMEMKEEDAKIFATRDDMAPEALIKMAASVQSFVMGDVRLKLHIPASVSAQIRGDLLLMGWKSGLRSMALHQEGIASLGEKAQLIKRQTKAIPAHKDVEPIKVPQSRQKVKAPQKTVRIQTKTSKTISKSKRH